MYIENAIFNGTETRPHDAGLQIPRSYGRCGLRYETGSTQGVLTVVDSSFTSFADGGMRLSGSDVVVTVQRSLFQDNQATGAQSDGAGIHASGAHLIVSDSSFIRNDASSGEGGALFFSASAPATLSRVSFIDNSANTLGGAISCAETTALRVEQSSFAQNSAGTAGSALNFLSGGASSSIFNCSFLDHSSSVPLVRADSPLQWVCQPGHWPPPTTGDLPQSDFVGCPNHCDAGFYGPLANMSGAADCTPCTQCPSGVSSHRECTSQTDTVCTPAALPYKKEASLSFGPSSEHRLNCEYTLLENGQFDMSRTGCQFVMSTD